MIVFTATAAPLIAALGALSPSFAVLTGTQTIGRPLGLALDVLVAVVAAEEMPRSSRTYAISVLAMASGLGAGLCVMALPLADIGTRGWRLVYVLPLLLMIVARDLARRLPETRRFEEQHATAPTCRDTASSCWRSPRFSATCSSRRPRSIRTAT